MIGLYGAISSLISQAREDRDAELRAAAALPPEAKVWLTITQAEFEALNNRLIKVQEENARLKAEVMPLRHENLGLRSGVPVKPQPLR